MKVEKRLADSWVRTHEPRPYSSEGICDRRSFAKLEWNKFKPEQDWHALAMGATAEDGMFAIGATRTLERLHPLTEAEAAFQIHSRTYHTSHLHQKAERVQAHILVSSCLRPMEDVGQIAKQPRSVMNATVIEELADIPCRCRLANSCRINIRKRVSLAPSEHQKILLDKLKLALPVGIIQNEM